MKMHKQRSSGNVFADIGLPDSEQEQLKVKLNMQIDRIITAHKLTQLAVANLLGTAQPQVSGQMRLRPTSLLSDGERSSSRSWFRTSNQP
jgi:predicted XRE-type DNA-binding protein